MKVHELIEELSTLVREQETILHYDVLILDELENIMGSIKRVYVDNDPDNDKLVVALQIKNE